MFFDMIGKYIIVSMVVVLVYGMDVLSTEIIKKFYKKDFIDSYLFQFWSLILFIIVWHFNSSKLSVFRVPNLLSLKNVLLIFISIIPTSIIVCGRKIRSSKPLEKFVDGMSMEVPQRLLVQNLFIVLGINTVIYGELTLGILLTALIWVQFIVIQEIIIKNKITFNVIPELIASFWFSIWVGILYSMTGNIVIAMGTHGLERIVAYGFQKLKDEGSISL